MKKFDSLRKFKGKQLVSFIRNGDYAHAGEEEAIDISLLRYPLSNSRKILDVGCGLGKTADYIHDKGYGHVTGVDVEQESIESASIKYSNSQFVVCDAHCLTKKLASHSYDLVVFFNSFYAFKEQKTVLAETQKILKRGGQIMIFDYINLLENNNPLHRDGTDGELPFIPINKKRFVQTLTDYNWHHVEYMDLSSKYQEWYSFLLRMLLENEEEVIIKFGREAYAKAFICYSKILFEILSGTLGGGVFYAEA